MPSAALVSYKLVLVNLFATVTVNDSVITSSVFETILSHVHGSITRRHVEREKIEFEK